MEGLSQCAGYGLATQGAVAPGQKVMGLVGGWGCLFWLPTVTLDGRGLDVVRQGVFVSQICICSFSLESLLALN